MTKYYPPQPLVLSNMCIGQACLIDAEEIIFSVIYDTNSLIAIDSCTPVFYTCQGFMTTETTQEVMKRLEKKLKAQYSYNDVDNIWQIPAGDRTEYLEITRQLFQGPDLKFFLHSISGDVILLGYPL